jgi:threonine dehydratase
MMLPSLAMIRDAQSAIHRYMPSTPQYCWPLVSRRLGSEAWIKHENHTPVGAFKIRGALLYVSHLRETQPALSGVLAATRGNHGQGVAMAARLNGLKCVIVVPHGNSVEKNRAMIAQGAELVERGYDFQESLEFAHSLAAERGYAIVPSFHEKLVLGTATYAIEFFQGAPALDVVYVPIGLGSSICGVSAVRNALGLNTEIVGVVAADSPSYSLSFSQRRIIEAPAGTELADGLACRKPNPEAMEIIWQNVSRIIEVSDSEIACAMQALYHDTHNVAEGAAASSMAAAIREKHLNRGKRIGIVLTGGNVDTPVFARVLAGETER